MSNAAKIEALMKSMQYSAEKIAEVLATLSTRKKVQSDDTIEETLLAKKHCEAHLISKLLEQKEVEEAEMNAERAAAGKKTKPAAQVETTPKTSETPAEKDSKPGVPADKSVWPVHKDTAAGLDDSPEIPMGCKLRQYIPSVQSPYWRGELPMGETYHGKASRTRSYQHSAGVGCAKFTSDQARAAVVAWLWEWHDTQHAKSSASSSGGPAKKLKST